MIIVGDIACPTPVLAGNLRTVFTSNPNIFGGKQILANLEGLVSSSQTTNTNSPILFNHPTSIEVLAEANVVAVGLANNHTLDLPQAFSSTIKLLNEQGIAYLGAGTSKMKAKKHVKLNIDDNEVILFNYCWDFLLYHQSNPSHGINVATIDELALIEELKCARQENRQSTIIVYLHWSFDLESLPFPMYRQFSRALIDAGANVVIGCHSHCVQGGEKYKDGYIVYGLGNFFIPNNIFADGKLRFPDFARCQLAFEYDIHENKACCHWFHYENTESHVVTHITSEEFTTSKKLLEYSPFTGMSDKEYLFYFKKHRRKRRLIPIYTDYRKKHLNSIYTIALKARALTARKLAELNIIGWQH